MLDINSLNNESHNIEYKETWRDEFIKWICGFANAQGGVIYLGITDNKEICGVRDAKKLLEDIPNKVKDLLGIIVDVNLLQNETKEYIEIIIEPSNVPISYKGQYFYRTGSTKQELKGASLQHFLLKKIGKQWDDLPYEAASLDCIDANVVKYFVKRAITSGRLSDDIDKDNIKNILENLHLFTDEGKLKNAAILLFGKDPLKYFTGIQFKIGRFGINEADLIFQDEVEGNIFQMADKVLNILKSKYLRSFIHYEGMQRIETLEIPESSLREILYNAIVHKEYPGYPILMHVYDDHIELWNEGRLPEGYTVETLLSKHSSKPRNANIANVFYKAGFIEAWGRGYSKIMEGFKNADLPLPTLQERDGGLVINFQRSNKIESYEEMKDNDEYNIQNNNLSVKTAPKTAPKTTPKTAPKTAPKTTQKVLDLIRKYPAITQLEISEKCNISIFGVKWQIKQLKKKGVIERVGGNKSGYWIVKMEK